MKIILIVALLFSQGIRAQISGEFSTGVLNVHNDLTFYPVSQEDFAYYTIEPTDLPTKVSILAEKNNFSIGVSWLRNPFKITASGFIDPSHANNILTKQLAAHSISIPFRYMPVIYKTDQVEVRPFVAVNFILYHKINERILETFARDEPNSNPNILVGFSKSSIDYNLQINSDNDAIPTTLSTGVKVSFGHVYFQFEYERIYRSQHLMNWQNRFGHYLYKGEFSPVYKNLWLTFGLVLHSKILRPKDNPTEI